MRGTVRMAALLLCCFVPFLASARGDAKGELKKFQGTWKATKLVYNGKELPTDGKGSLTLVFKDDVATIEASDKVKKEYGSARFKLDPTTTPKCVDVTVIGGTQKDAVMEGIYEFKGDELTLCLRVLGTDRPTKFEATEGGSLALLVLKKE